MGGANNICSDKTGTLTLNKMTLTNIWNGNLKTIDTYEEKSDIKKYMNSDELAELFVISSCVNSIANLRPEPKGSSTEIAMLNFMEKTGNTYESYRELYPTKLKYPFSSARKRMSVVIDYKGENTLFVKGASEMILACCSKWFNIATGKVEDITPHIKTEMEEAIVSMAEKSLRTLCFAYKRLSNDDNLEAKDDRGIFNVEKNDLIVIALLGVKDIARQEVPGAIAKCHKAGIKVRMVTGDNIITARAIATEVGILKEGDGSLVMEGSEFIKIVGGVVCKKCQVAVCNCAKDSKQADETGEDIRVDTISNGE